MFILYHSPQSCNKCYQSSQAHWLVTLRHLSLYMNQALEQKAFNIQGCNTTLAVAYSCGKTSMKEVNLRVNENLRVEY